MKVTIDMENLGNIVEQALNKNLNETIENEIYRVVQHRVKELAQETIENIVNEKLKSYVNDYVTTATVSVGGGWNSEPQTYTVDEYIKKEISDIMNTQKLKTTDRYGDRSKTVTFDEYIKNAFDIDKAVQNAMDKFMKDVKNNVNKNITNMFNTTTQAALSDVIMNMLNNSNAFLEMKDNLARITDGR